MKKLFLFFIYIFFISVINAQNFEKIYESLSLKDKLWCVKNIDCVISAIDISNDVIRVVDSLDKVNFLSGNSEGGRFDAFRHIFWMYNLTNEIGEECSRKIGQIYENYGYYIYTLNPNSGYDSVGMEMDLFNNELGISLSKIKIENNLIINKIHQIIISGQAKVIKKTQNGENLDVMGVVIKENEWRGIWNNKRVLVSSDWKE